MPLWLLRIISPKKAVEVQIARITTKLIRRSFGPFGTVTRKFKKSIQKYNAGSTPISTEEAKELLVHQGSPMKQQKNSEKSASFFSLKQKSNDGEKVFKLFISFIKIMLVTV